MDARTPDALGVCLAHPFQTCGLERRRARRGPWHRRHRNACLRLVAEHLGVDVDADMLRLDLGAFVPGSAPPTLALTYVIVWSELLVPYLGTVMLRRLQMDILEMFGAPRQDGSRDLADTRQELVHILRVRRWQSLGLSRLGGEEERAYR